MVPGPAMTATVVKQAPIVGTFHRAGPSRSYHYLNRAVRWLRRRIEVSAAVSEEAANMARDSMGGEYEVLFNGVELGRYDVAGSTRRPTPTIFFVGRHEPRKGLSVLLEAMRELPSDVTLWVGSDGPETDRLQAQSAGDPRIEWLGRITDQEKIERLGQASVFCAPSLSGESFGVVLLEAMAAQIPVVASNLAGYALVARSGRDALLTTPGDPSALAASLRRVLDDSRLSAQLTTSGYDRANEFSMDRLADRYVTLYEKAIGADPAATLA